MLKAALSGCARSWSFLNFAPARAAEIARLADQTPCASSEVVTCDPLPVRSRRYRAVTIPAYKPTAVALSPLPPTGSVGDAPASRVSDSRPLRAQYAVMSK